MICGMMRDRWFSMVFPLSPALARANGLSAAAKVRENGVVVRENRCQITPRRVLWGTE